MVESGTYSALTVTSELVLPLGLTLLLVAQLLLLVLLNFLGTAFVICRAFKSRQQIIHARTVCSILWR